MEPVLTTPERRLRSLLKFLLFVDVVMLFFHLFPQWTPDFLGVPAIIAYLAFASGSLVVGGLVGLLLILSIGDLRRFSALIRIINIYFAAALVWWVIHWISEEAEFGSPIADTTLTLAAFTLLLFLLFQWAGKGRYGLKYLSAMQFVTLQAIAEVCVAGESTTDKLKIGPHKVALNVDDYLSRFDAKSKWVMKLVLSCMEIYPRSPSTSRSAS